MAATAIGRNSGNSTVSAASATNSPFSGDRGEEVRTAARHRTLIRELDRDRDDHRHGREHGEAGPVAPPAEDEPQLRTEEPGADPAHRPAVGEARDRRAQPLTSKPSPVSETNTSSRSGATIAEAPHRHAVVDECRHHLLRRDRAEHPGDLGRSHLHLGESQLAHHPGGVLRPVRLDPSPGYRLRAQLLQRSLRDQPAQVHHADVAADLLHLGQQMGGEHHRRALAPRAR